MHLRSLAASWGYSAAAYVGVALSSGCMGGQSGGETDDRAHAQPDAPQACACVPLGQHAVHARVTRLEGGCAELVVIALLDEPMPDEYMPLAVGDAFGGVLTPLCPGSPEVNEGDDVLALFSRGTQDSVTCPEYRSCSSENCGDPNALTTTTISNECAERQSKDPSVDCEPITLTDEDALAEFDRCDTRCLEETREVCVSHAGDTQLGGNVSVAPWADGQVSFYWAGQQRTESFAALLEPTCQQRHHRVWSEYYEALSSQSGNPSQHDVAAPPPNPSPNLVCPLAPRD